MSMIRASVSMIRASQTFVLAVNLVVDLMKEVESERINALILAKEANDMHVREVCTENAILATKLKELQLHLFTMSDELLLNALTKVKFFASPPAAAIAASSPAIYFFCSY
ncbi:hypothetical protein Tco_1453628 [Tanacetum coccineum]